MKEIHTQFKQKNLITKKLCYTLDLEEDHAGILSNYYEGLDYLEDFIQFIKEKEY